MKDKLTFHNHPLKNQIIERWEEKQDNAKVRNWLLAEHPEVVLSQPTLAKHHRRWLFNKKRLASTNKNPLLKKQEISPVEEILWETIAQCRKMKRSKSISVKEWQYLDQQAQNAIEKLIRITEGSGGGRDISTVLSEIFQKLEAGEDVEIEDVAKEELDEKKKLEIIKNVDNENKPQGEETVAA